MSPQTLTRPTSSWDAAALVAFMIAGAVITAMTVIGAVIRMTEVLAPGPVPVFAVFGGTPALAPIGPDGAEVEVALESATILAPELPAASVGALVAQQVVVIAAVIAVVGSLVWLALNIVRQRVFSKTNSWLVAVATFAGLGGAFLSPFLGNVGANGAFADISDRTFDNVVLQVEFGPFVLLAFVTAIANLVFTVGYRLQRETEGLV